MSPEEKEIYFNVALSTSLVLFGFDGEDLRVLIKQEKSPFKGTSLPSDYIKADENIESKIRELLFLHIQKENVYIGQLKPFYNVFRHPEGRVVNIAFYGAVRLDENLLDFSKSKGEEWVKYYKVPELLFDHNQIIEHAKEVLKRKMKRKPISYYFLPNYFTISKLQKLYEQVLDKEIDKRNFRKKIIKSQLIVETNLKDNSSSKKSAKLYKFDREKYKKALSLKE